MPAAATASGSRHVTAAWPTTGLGRVSLFAWSFAALQLAYHALSSSSWMTPVVQASTAAPAAALLCWLDPTLPTHAESAQLQWLGGQLALLAGCDGADVLLLYLPAAMIAPTSWQRRGLMVACGIVAIWLLNQARVVVLVQMYRQYRGGFDAAHTVWAPLALALSVTLLYGWLLRARRANP